MREIEYSTNKMKRSIYMNVTIYSDKCILLYGKHIKYTACVVFSVSNFEKKIIIICGREQVELFVSFFWFK